jgi:glyoxylase-like metal-dependent hydrolase (beta-lactamase superfamily II)
MMRWNIGDVTVTAISDLDPFAIPIGRIFPTAEPALLEPHRALLVPDHVDETLSTINLTVQAFLLQVDGLNILIDTCIGEDKKRPHRPDWDLRQDTGFLGRLEAAGVAAEAVDIVFCTHLHADHVGWNTQWTDGRWVPTFPKARYLIGRAEFEHWDERRSLNHGAFNDSVLPVVESGQVDLVDDGYEVARGMILMPLHGHSIGQMGLLIDRGDTKALFCGDAIHSPVQIVRPEWASAFCHDPAAAVALRERLLGEMAEDRRLLVPAHFRGSGRVLIQRNADGTYLPLFVEA